ncbi:MAG: hypothetical protein AB7P07_15375 [Hyphomonadaceae bacterium]
MINRRFFLAATVSVGACAAAHPHSEPHGQEAPPTHVMVIATIHGAHRNSTTYSYDHLYERVRAFAPTAIGVEIRPEDLSPPAAYLASYYPREMIALSQEYAAIAAGLDWLGPTIEGQPIPDGYFPSTGIPQLSAELEADAAFDNAELDALSAQKAALVPDATASSLNDGRYDAINRDYYRRFAALVQGSRYQPLADFYAARDAHIVANALALIRANPGGRVALVVGADHRSAVVDAIAAELAGTATLEPV